MADGADTQQPGVYLGQTQLPAAHKDIMVRVVNTSSEPRFVKQGTFLGNALPDECVDEQTKVSTEPSPTAEPASRKVIARLSEELTDTQVQQITELLSRYESASSQHDFDIGRTQLVKHTIDTGITGLLRSR